MVWFGVLKLFATIEGAGMQISAQIFSCSFCFRR